MGNLLNVVALDDDLILDIREGDLDTLEHGAVSDELFTQEVSDLEGGAIIAGKGVDGEMRVNKSHLVEEALGDTGDHVLDQRLDGSETSDVLSGTVPDSEDNLGALGSLNLQ